MVRTITTATVCMYKAARTAQCRLFSYSSNRCAGLFCAVRCGAVLRCATPKTRVCSALFCSALLYLPRLQPNAVPCTGDSGIPRRACRATQRAHTVFQVRFRLIRLPVVRKPLSPIAPRHSIDNWPSVARPSFRKSFCRASSPSVRFSSCSTRNATCSTSRGLSVGGPVPGLSDKESQFSETDLKGGFGFSLVCCRR